MCRLEGILWLSKVRQGPTKPCRNWDNILLNWNINHGLPKNRKALPAYCRCIWSGRTTHENRRRAHRLTDRDRGAGTSPDGGRKIGVDREVGDRRTAHPIRQDKRKYPQGAEETRTPFGGLCSVPGGERSGRPGGTLRVSNLQRGYESRSGGWFFAGGG